MKRLKCTGRRQPLLPTAADSSDELLRSFSPPPASRLSALTLETSAARLPWARPLRSDRLDASTRRSSRRPRVCALDVPTWPPFGWKRCTNATSAARSFGGSPACPDVDPWHRMPSTVENATALVNKRTTSATATLETKKKGAKEKRVSSFHRSLFITRHVRALQDSPSFG